MYSAYSVLRSFPKASSHNVYPIGDVKPAIQNQWCGIVILAKIAGTKYPNVKPIKLPAKL